MLYKTIDSPVGPLTLTERDGTLCGLDFGNQTRTDDVFGGKIVLPSERCSRNGYLSIIIGTILMRMDICSVLGFICLAIGTI